MESNEQAPTGFRRQVTFRIGPADAPLLELVARAHGGIQAGIVAALRAHAAERLQPPPTDKLSVKPDAPAHEPEAARDREADESDETVELNVGEAAAALRVTPSTLRERIKRGTHPGRVGSNGLYLAEVSLAALRESGVHLSPRGAAEVVGLKPATVKKRCKEGRYPNARHDGLAWTILATDLLEELRLAR
jgi:hypothetical protein